MLNAIKKNGATLALFACASTGLVAFTNFLTKDTIQEQEQAQLLSVLNQVIAPSMHDNRLYKSCTLVSDELLGTSEPMPTYIATKDGQPTALAIESIAPDGYNGTIKLIVGLTLDGTITGTRVLAHKETPGLGDKIDLRVSDWILTFAGKRVSEENLADWNVRKDGGQFDQFTGATITPRAVVKAVKNSALLVNRDIDTILTQPRNCGGSDE
ncbi:electron transport complex subunit RsxG [Vibrio sonorensis]|uniref:electron transport complex subunit RsxG n=1 Tax=Vibrio sonorensis TaxID=1004316 RepID=UPI0008DA9988|nr:electron transport complex subunit RsxG [Vibrio sonorensis]